MKNCNTLFVGNRKLDTWPRVGLPAGASLSTRMNQAPPQRSSHTCYVISEEPHFEQAADSCGEVAVMNENVRNSEKTRQLTRGESSFGHGEASTASTVLQDVISNRSRSTSQHNLNISSGYSLEKSNINNISDQSKRCLSIPEQPERLPGASQLSRVHLNSHTNQQRGNVSDSCDNARESDWIRDDSELKSGSLVLIVQCYDHSNGGRVAASDGLSPTSRNSCTVQRFPVLVKIYQNCERYAIVMRTARRHQSTPSLYMKLKKCSVVRSTANPSHFVVMVGGHDGKSYRFEASSTKSADEWMQAFSGDVTPWYKSSVQPETRRDTFPEALSRPVNENDDPSLSPPSPQSANPQKSVSRKVHKIPLRHMPSLSESSDEDTS